MKKHKLVIKIEKNGNKIEKNGNEIGETQISNKN